MNFQEFALLDGTDQLKFVGQRGQLILERHTRDARSLYYRVRSFVVELRFHGTDQGHVEITSFTAGHPRFLQLLCLLPAASLRSISEKARTSPLSFVWN
ncbi:MAG: hypothetical protein JNM62_11965 [Flavobacteriales bacterium]|nr:hypothetical protein [Flavobacteriales bacterium]